MTVRCGVDNRSALLDALAPGRVGLITNHTGLTSSGEPTAVALMKNPDITVDRMFAPEHGLAGEIEDLGGIDDTTDPVTGLSVFSLYGVTEEPSAEALQGLDALVFDIQDIGARYYTFNWTMIKCMKAAARVGTRFVVLDRPNPITGSRVEGNVSRTEFSSLIGLYPCAARHGMTSGEIALYVNEEYSVGADLTVVPMLGWSRGMWFDQTGLTFVPPSPNTTGLNMVTLYPGTCLFEGTNLSEGRGTSAPFEVIGAPWLDPVDLAARLEDPGLPGVWFRPTYFIPYTSKHAGRRCGGVHVHIRDRCDVDAFGVGLHMLYAVRNSAPEFEWRNDPGRYAIDLLAGTDELRLALDEGATPDDLTAAWSEGLELFEEVRRGYLMYS